MNRISYRFFGFFVLLALVVPGGFVVAEEHEQSGEVQSLQQLIEARGDELRVIQEEREALAEELEEVNQTQSVLKRDIGRINYSINQLDLSVRSNKVIVEKLGFEIDSLQDDIRSVEVRVEDRRETIGHLFQKLYERDHDSFLVIFLRHRTLAEGVGAVQSIVSLNSDLTVSIGELKDFQTELVRQAAYVTQKRGDREEERQNLQYRQEISADQRRAKQSFLAQTKVEEREYERQIAALDREQAEISSVIEGIEDQLRASFDPTLVPIPRAGVIGYPVKSPRITQRYGRTAFAQKTYKSKSHTGIDLAVGLGTPLYSAEDGVVRAVGNNDKGTSRWRRYQYGKYALIDHDNSLTTLYAHTSRIIVSVGERVTRGQLIGYSGNTGYSTGPHLHFGVYWTPSVQFKKIPPAAGLVPIGITIDPADYL